MRWNGDIKEFVQWFVSAGTKDEQELRTALQSVPREPWPRVEPSLLLALHNEKKKQGSSNPIVVTQALLETYGLLETKETLLQQENARRTGPS